MQELSNVAYACRGDLQRKEQLEAEVKEQVAELVAAEERIKHSLEAQNLLGTVADEKANAVLDYVTGILNKTLSEIFPGDAREIALERKMHGGKHPHITVVLRTGDGVVRDMVTQSGTGLRQIVSFLYRLCLIEVTGSRKLVIIDELLSGVHKDAIVVIEDLIKIFAAGGFQFVIVDYAIATEFGLTYLVEKPGKIASIRAVESGFDDEEVVGISAEAEEEYAKALATSD